MVVPASKSNPKIQCQYVLLKAETFLMHMDEKMYEEKRKYHMRKKSAGLAINPVHAPSI